MLKITKKRHISVRSGDIDRQNRDEVEHRLVVTISLSPSSLITPTGSKTVTYSTNMHNNQRVHYTLGLLENIFHIV